MDFLSRVNFAQYGFRSDRLGPKYPNKPIYASHVEIDVLARSKFKLCISIRSGLIVQHFSILEMYGGLLHECNATRVEEIRGLYIL